MTTSKPDISPRMISLSDKAGANRPQALCFESNKPSDLGLVLLHDWWGLTDGFHALAGFFAHAGYTTIAPDLYDGARPKHPLEAMRLLKNMDLSRVIDEYLLSAQSKLSRPTTLIGFSMGGGLALLAAAREQSFCSVISFYGLPRDGDQELDGMSKPVQVHLCDQDEFFSKKRTDAFLAHFEAHPSQFDCHRYKAAHGFCNSDRPDIYNREIAKLSLSRCLDFLERSKERP